MTQAQAVETDASRPWNTLNNHYRYLINNESFQKLRLFMIENGYYPYGNEDCLAIVITKKAQTGWRNVRIETSKMKNLASETKQD